MDVEAILMVLIIYASSLLLHMVLPSRVVKGYVCSNDGKPLYYRLNGILVELIMCSIFYYLMPISYQRILYDNYGSALMTANILGKESIFFITIHSSASN